MIPAGAFPSAASYVALGHLHRAQLMPGPAPIWYSGSPIQVDFGESDDRKQVLLVDAPASGSARVSPIAASPKQNAATLKHKITAGRKFRRR